MKKIFTFIRKFVNRNDSTVNSKLVTMLWSIFMLTITSFLVLFGVPPIDAIHVGDVIDGLVLILLSAAGISTLDSFVSKKFGGEKNDTGKNTEGGPENL